MPPPPNPPVYHITHVGNLPGIVSQGGLLSHAAMVARGGPPAGIGMENLKARRLELTVPCHPGDRVGEYVPFYFCPRSVMLYVISMANHARLSYRGGQGPILHLEVDLHAAVKWACANSNRWAFSLSNASASYSEFRTGLQHLGEIDWTAVHATDFRNPDVKHAKQAEFLVYGKLPWNLVSRIGAASEPVAAQARAAMQGAAHQPPVVVMPAWYF